MTSKLFAVRRHCNGYAPVFESFHTSYAAAKRQAAKRRGAGNNVVTTIDGTVLHFTWDVLDNSDTWKEHRPDNIRH